MPLLSVLCLILNFCAFGQMTKDTLYIESGEEHTAIFVDSVYFGMDSALVPVLPGIHYVAFASNQWVWNSPVGVDGIKTSGIGERKHISYPHLPDTAGMGEKKTMQWSSINTALELNKTNGLPKEKLFFRTNLFKYLTGSVIAFGAAAAYLKIKADNRYDDYLLTQNSGTLRETRKLDTYSGVAFALTQINLAALVYYFLADQ